MILQVLLQKGKVLEARKRVVASSFFANLLAVLESTDAQSADSVDDDATALEEPDPPQSALRISGSPFATSACGANNMHLLQYKLPSKLLTIIDMQLCNYGT